MTRLVARTVVLRSTIGASPLLGAWLSLAAMPARADGGIHVTSSNSGAGTLTADGRAGCHRARTAQGAMLLALPESEEALCPSCHGAAGTGATTDVETGVQYALGAGGLRGWTAAGALRVHP